MGYDLTPLADLLLGPLRQRVLSRLLLHPDTSLHVRELARQTGSQPGTLNRELAKLARAGVLLRQQVGNQVHYQANPACPVFSDLAGLLRKTAGLAAVLADVLAPLADAGRIRSALVYGSVARGEETALSDVDVLILGDLALADAVEALHPAQDTLRREINPAVYRPADFATALAAANSWARDIVAKPKLFVIGDADDFAELAGHPAAAGV